MSAVQLSVLFQPHQAEGNAILQPAPTSLHLNFPLAPPTAGGRVCLGPWRPHPSPEQDHPHPCTLFFQMARYAAELQRLHALFSGMDGGQAVGRPEAEAALRNAEELVEDLREDAEQLAGNRTGRLLSDAEEVAASITTISHLLRPIGLETRLQGRLQSFTTSRLADERDIRKIAETAGDVGQQRQTYKSTAEDVQTLMEAMKRQLDRARADLRSAVRHCWSNGSQDGQGTVWT